jgi:hypothetical protein
MGRRGRRSGGASRLRELSVFSLGVLRDITPVEDEIEMSELQNLEGEVEVLDSTENVKPVWVERRINLPCLQPVS